MKTTVMALVLVGAAGAGKVLAAPLAPTKASQVVVLRTTALGSAPCSSEELRVDRVVNGADGTFAPFTIPEGQVLVLTGGTWFAQLLPASSTVFLRIRLRGEVPGPSSDVVTAGATADAGGVASGSFTVQPGIVVKPGGSLCVQVATSAGTVAGSPTLYGFLAKDK